MDLGAERKYETVNRYQEFYDFRESEGKGSTVKEIFLPENNDDYTFVPEGTCKGSS